MSEAEQYQVVVVGAGFAGVACAKQLAKHGVRVLLIDKNNYHEFQPLLYQLATSQLGVGDITRSLRGIFRTDESVTIKTAEVVEVDPAARTVTTADGERYTAEVLVLSPGAVPNFFGTEGAAEHSFPLYSAAQAIYLREHVLGLLDAVSRDPERVADGALTFVVVGAGPTGVETAGALAELVRDIVPHFYRDVPAERAEVHLVDLGHQVLNGFSDKAHKFAAKKLEEDGVQIRLGVGVHRVGAGHVWLSDGTDIPTRTVVWGGGEQAAPLLGTAGLTQGRGGRIDVADDLTAPEHDRVYVLGDAANIAGPGGKPYPQLGSIAQQSGDWAADNVRADLAGKARKPFHYHDKGIMAMIGRNAAVAELGAHRHEVDGPMGFAAWLGVHAMLLSGLHEKTDAFMKWGWEYVSKRRPDFLLESRSEVAIDWGEDEDEEPPSLATDQPGAAPAPPTPDQVPAQQSTGS